MKTKKRRQIRCPRSENPFDLPLPTPFRRTIPVREQKKQFYKNQQMIHGECHGITMAVDVIAHNVYRVMKNDRYADAQVHCALKSLVDAGLYLTTTLEQIISDRKDLCRNVAKGSREWPVALSRDREKIENATKLMDDLQVGEKVVGARDKNSRNDLSDPFTAYALRLYHLICGPSFNPRTQVWNHIYNHPYKKQVAALPPLSPQSVEQWWGIALLIWDNVTSVSWLEEVMPLAKKRFSKYDTTRATSGKLKGDVKEIVRSRFRSLARSHRTPKLTSPS